MLTEQQIIAYAMSELAEIPTIQADIAAIAAADERAGQIRRGPEIGSRHRGRRARGRSRWMCRHAVTTEQAKAKMRRKCDRLAADCSRRCKRSSPCCKGSAS